MNIQDAIDLYKQAIIPLMEYGNFLIDSGPATLIKKFQPLQNRGLRICLKKRIGQMSTNKLHKKCKVERLDIRRKRQLACLMYRHSQVKGNLASKPNMRTRGDLKVKLKVERPKRSKYRSSPLYRGMQVWDELPLHLQELPDVAQFKTKLKSHLK